MVDIMNTGCLDEKTLSSYLDERLSVAEREKIEKHIADCNVCLDMLLLAYESGRKKFSIRPATKSSAGFARTISNSFRARMLNRQGNKPAKKRPELKWLFLAILCFALSFIVRHYFLQFLAAATILGFKWVMEGEAAKRVIMIFKGIQEKEKKFERKSPPDVSNIAGGDRYGESE